MMTINFYARLPLGINFDEEATKFFDPEALKRISCIPPAAGRRVDLHRRSGSRVSARNGRGSAADPRRRSRSGPPHGARQAAHAEGDQPFRPGAAGGGGNGRADQEGRRRTRQHRRSRAMSKKARPADTKKRAEIAPRLFADVMIAPQEAAAVAGQARSRSARATRSRASGCACKLNRAKVETSLAIRRVPFRASRSGSEFTREIERAVEELNHLDRGTEEARSARTARRSSRASAN